MKKKKEVEIRKGREEKEVKKKKNKQTKAGWKLEI